MSRPRKHDKRLPAYVRIRHGSYLYRDHKLCRVDDGEARMYEELAKRKALPSIETIPTAVATFRLEYLKAPLAQSTIDDHGRYLTIFADEFEEFTVAQVSAPDIRRSTSNLYGQAPVAARHYKSCISRFFRWCVEEKGLRADNPCREVKLRKPKAKRTPWTDALFWAAREHLPAMQQCYHDLSYLIYQRTTDVRVLKRTQIREADGVIHFEPTKTLRSSGAAVDIPITPAIKAVLDRAAAISKEWKVVCHYVIHTRQGTAFTRSGIYSAYRRADEALHGPENVIGLNPKALRPYALTSAKKIGFGIEQLQVGAAHTSLTTTEGYIQAHEVPVSAVNLALPVRPK